MFHRSLRLAEFGTIVDVVYEMPAWFFALNHTNYAQWLSIHVRDMLDLGEKAPGVAEADVRFSAIVIDQAHEQNNAMVKGEGGAADLTENPSALRWWMLSEMARLVNEFYTCAAPEINPKSRFHHEAEKGF